MSSSFESHLTPAYLHNLKIKCGFTNLIIVNFYNACLMEGMMMAPTSIRMLVKIANRSITYSLVTSLIWVDGMRRAQ